MNIPFITTEQMREVDRLMIEEFGIELLMMMENAGRGLAEFCSKYMGYDQDRSVLIFIGGGNNGGGGLVAARYSHQFGYSVEVMLLQSESYMKEVPRKQLEILQKLHGIAIVDDIAQLHQADLVIDAMIGYGIEGDLRDPYASTALSMNVSGVPIIALDVPSGLTLTIATVQAPAVRATATYTLALPKDILKDNASYTGDVYVGNIGVPQEVYKRLSIDVLPLFHKSSSVLVDSERKS